MRRTSGTASSDAVISSSCPRASPSPTSIATDAKRSRRAAWLGLTFVAVGAGAGAVVVIGNLLLLSNVSRGGHRVLPERTEPALLQFAYTGPSPTGALHHA